MTCRTQPWSSSTRRYQCGCAGARVCRCFDGQWVSLLTCSPVESQRSNKLFRLLCGRRHATSFCVWQAINIATRREDMKKRTPSMTRIVVQPILIKEVRTGACSQQTHISAIGRPFRGEPREQNRKRDIEDVSSTSHPFAGHGEKREHVRVWVVASVGHGDGCQQTTMATLRCGTQGLVSRRILGRAACQIEAQAALSRAAVSTLAVILAQLLIRRSCCSSFRFVCFRRPSLARRLFAALACELRQCPGPCMAVVAHWNEEEEKVAKCPAVQRAGPADEATRAWVGCACCDRALRHAGARPDDRALHLPAGLAEPPHDEGLGFRGDRASASPTAEMALGVVDDRAFEIYRNGGGSDILPSEVEGSNSPTRPPCPVLVTAMGETIGFHSTRDCMRGWGLLLSVVRRRRQLRRPGQQPKFLVVPCMASRMSAYECRVRRARRDAALGKEVRGGRSTWCLGICLAHHGNRRDDSVVGLWRGCVCAHMCTFTRSALAAGDSQRGPVGAECFSKTRCARLHCSEIGLDGPCMDVKCIRCLMSVQFFVSRFLPSRPVLHEV